MRSLKRLVAITLTSFILLSTSIVANAETSQEIQNSESKLEQNAELINQKETEQKMILTELQDMQSGLHEIENEMSKNKEEVSLMEQKIDETKKMIEEKKAEIVVLEDKVLARKGIMEERLVSIHNNDQASLIIEILVDSENFNELIQRVTAVSTVLNADKDLLESQQQDLKKIETEKLEIDKQEQILEEQNNMLATKQVNLEQNLQKRQEIFTAVQEKYNTISNEISLAENDKQVIQDQLKSAQANLKSEQEAATARAKASAEKAAQQLAEQPAQQPAVVKQPSAPKNDSNSNTSTSTVKEVSKSNESTNKAKELYVSATAYSHESSITGLTATGYNIKANPNMKLIAVDPSVIPLGTKVWVEGYGEAVAGDTGGAIKGHKIDVLMPSSAQAISWGRKTVKIVILN